MKEKKTMKQRMEEAKAWFDEHKGQIGATVVVFLTGTIVGIVKGTEIRKNYLDDTIEVSLQKGYERGTCDTRNRIGYGVLDNGSYELVNSSGDVLTLTGTLTKHEDEESEKEE